jgi:hypothetical protein
VAQYNTIQFNAKTGEKNFNTKVDLVPIHSTRLHNSYIYKNTPIPQDVCAIEDTCMYVLAVREHVYVTDYFHRAAVYTHKLAML